MGLLGLIGEFLANTGIAGFIALGAGWWRPLVMLGVGGLLIYLAIAKEYEPLLLIPIGFACILVNLPLTELFHTTEELLGGADRGLLDYIFTGLATGVFPPLIFLGLGAMTDFSPLLAKPQTFLLGAAAQFGIFGTLLAAQAMGFSFTRQHRSPSSAVPTAPPPSSSPRASPTTCSVRWRWRPTPTWRWCRSSSRRSSAC